MKSLLCAIGKLENLYIREWVSYHLNIGFDHILLYDNNDVNGERIYNVISDYVECGDVEIIPVYGERGNNVYNVVDGVEYKSIQIECYNDCYKNRSCNFDFVCFIDIDEFIYIENGANINDFLCRDVYSNYDYILLCWENYDDNGILEPRGNYSVSKFILPSIINGDEYYNNMGKCIVRCGINGININSAHGFYNDGLFSDSNKQITGCDSLGNALECGQIAFKKPIHEVAWIKHYSNKTISEYINIKSKRSWPDSWGEVNNISFNPEFFFRNNNMTKAKLDYINKNGLSCEYCDNRKIALVTMSGRNYITPLSVMLYSFMRNNMYFDGDVIVICIDEFSKHEKEFLRKIYGNIQFIWDGSTKDIKRNHVNWESKFNSMHKKFELFKLDMYDRVVYIDSDTLVVDSISLLFDTESDFAACVDKVEYNGVDELLFKKRNKEYFNSGVMSISKKFLGIDTYNSIVDMYLNFDYKNSKIDKTFNGRFQDQDILNEFFYGVNTALLLPCRYNVPQYTVIENPCIIHFLGEEKPWGFFHDSDNKFDAMLPYTKRWIDEYENFIEDAYSE